MLAILRKCFGIIWALPYTTLGASIGLLGMLGGGKARYREGCLEFHGGGTRWFVRHLPLGESTVAITFGHVVLGQTASGLVDSGAHERVHVRQYECWGPFFGPAYLLASAWMWILGKNAYRDNPFEVQAYRIAP